MPPPIKQTADGDHLFQRSSAGHPDNDEDMAFQNLWVGNLPADTVDSDLTTLFAKYGALDSVTTFPSRNYAFVYFKHVDAARAAMDALQGTLLRGNPVKLGFARPAKPCNQLWIGGISSSVTKEQLEDEFLKFGKVEDYKFFRERNSALIEFYKIDDATAALKSMNGKQLGGQQIRVDYLRSQPSRRDWSDHHDARDGHLINKRGMVPAEPLWTPPDPLRFFPEASHIGQKRLLPSGGRRDILPSKVLWIGYPPSVQIDEQMLHNAMILFGEIELIKSFPSRHFTLVEFRSIDEARRAKEGLQGRLFNDPRIQILFSSSELAPFQDNLSFVPGPRGPRPDMFFGEHPFAPMEYFGPHHPMAPSGFPGTLPPAHMPGSSMFGRPFAPQGFDPLLGGPEFFSDMKASGNYFPDGNVNNPLPANFRRLSPSGPGILSPVPGARPPVIPLPGMWDGLDVRDPKRSRIDGPSSEEASLHPRRMGSQGGDPYFLHQSGRGVVAPGSPIGVRGPATGFPGRNECPVAANEDHCWRGTIAKGGTPVCHARCVPLGNGIESPFPEIVNCSARTGLDMLTKHYAEADSFDVVFFLPDSEDDFASYTEFLRYLGLKNRAGVAKLDDGTTLFLVPPSDFLAKVLNVSGPERLYGVVLRMPQQMTAATQQPKQLVLPPAPLLAERQTPPPQTGYGLAPWNEGQTPQIEYNRVLPEEPLPYTTVRKPFTAHSDEARSAHSVPLNYVSNTASAHPVEVSLTPELIATLAAVIPTSALPSSAGSVQLSSNSSGKPPVSVSVVSDKAMPPQMWNQEPQAPTTGSLHLEHLSHPILPAGHEFGNQTAEPYTNIVNMSDPSGHALGGSHFQDNVLGVQQTATITAPFNNYIVPLQTGQFSASQTSQQNQVDTGFGSSLNYGISQQVQVPGLVHVPGSQQPNPTTSSQVPSGNTLQHWIVSPLTADKVNVDFPTQVQQLQNAISSSTQGPSESEAEKNQRYQSTLQLAASLLLQIQQQQQQQANAHAFQGSGNQQ